MRATILDLRYRTKEVLRAVERGETVTILYRGKEKARILPVATKGDDSELAASEAFGLWKDREDLRDVSRYVRELRHGRFHDF
jgi:prevent-host-death family protein